MKHRLRLVMLAALALAITACATEDAAPSDQELGELDAWAATADGKSDLPATWNKLVAWLQDAYRNRMSAIWENQEHPATPARALDRIRGIVARAGRDATTTLYPATLQRLDAGEIDHSEIDISMPDGTVIRLVGDPKGAGAFVDQSRFYDTVGPRLCLTWTELQTAINASYVPGAYGVDFVCHTVTERVMRSLGAGTAPYSGQYRTYAAARWIWGPVTPSFNSQTPSEWPISRSCN